MNIPGLPSTPTSHVFRSSRQIWYKTNPGLVLSPVNTFIKATCFFASKDLVDPPAWCILVLHQLDPTIDVPVLPSG